MEIMPTGRDYRLMHVTQASAMHAKAYLPCNPESESSIEEKVMQGVIHKMFKTCDQLASFQTFLRPIYYLLRPSFGHSGVVECHVQEVYN